jgi:hypothetical protein
MPSKHRLELRGFENLVEFDSFRSALELDTGCLAFLLQPESSVRSQSDAKERATY